MLEKYINKKGGIKGQKIRIIIKDSRGRPVQAVSFARQLIEEENVFAIIGPSTSGETLKIKQLCQQSSTLLLSCAAAEKIVKPVAPYVFKVAQKDSHVARHILKHMQNQNIKKIAVTCGNTSFGNEGLKQLKKYSPQYGIKIIIAEIYDKKSTDLSGIVTKIKSKKPEALVNWSIVPAQAILPRTMKQLKLDIPLYQSHGFANIKYAREAGKAGNGILFPSGRIFVAEQLNHSHPQYKPISRYKKMYEKTYNEPVSTFGGHAYDALMILVEVMNRNQLEPCQLQKGIENLKNFPGTAGVFNFSPADHNGLDINSLAMHWLQDEKFILLK